MALTLEQETFLAAFADKGIAEAAAEVARIAQAEAESEKYLAKQAFLTQLEEEQRLAKEQAIAEFEAGLTVEKP